MTEWRSLLNKVILLMLFFQDNHIAGAQLIGSVDSVPACQVAAAKLIGEHEHDLTKGVTPYPLCIDTTQLPKDKVIKPTSDQKTVTL
jgi:hypothetical protein